MHNVLTEFTKMSKECVVAAEGVGAGVTVLFILHMCSCGKLKGK